MIDHIIGQIETADKHFLVVTVANLGFTLQVPNPLAFQVGKTCTIPTYLHWHPENGPALYGFSSSVERKLFLLIINCSGIGPKIALALLGELTPSKFVKAISASDMGALSSVSGVGPKKAEQIVVQLRDKISSLADEGFEGATEDVARWKDVADALNSLNYSKPEVTRTLHHLNEQFAAKKTSFDELLRHALSYLAKRV